MSSISRDDVAHVARLARLDLGDAELDHFTRHLSSVLAHAEDMDALDLSDVPPMTHPLPLQNVWRPDVVGTTADRAEVLGQAPDHDEERFLVPPILGDDS